MSKRVVYLNGEYVAETEARISIFDSALMYGDMLFEMTRVFNLKPFRLREHLERLYSSLRYAEIDCGLTIDEMEEETHQTIEKNLSVVDGIDFQIMHNVTRGGMDYYDTLVKEGTSPIVTINVFPLIRHQGGMVEKYEKGAHAIVPAQQSVPSRFIDPKCKNRSRIFYKLADLQVAKMDKGAMALLTDEHGFITEGTGNNFFMAKDGEIYTAKPQNVLRGVSRHACMDYAAGLGIPVHEADIEPYDVRGADEAWYSSTTVCLAPITRFDFHPIGEGVPGPLYKKLIQAWSDDVGVDIIGQAREYAKLMDKWIP